MSARTCAGYQLIEQQPATAAGVEHWTAHGPAGVADVYIGSDEMRNRARALPTWGPFSRFRSGETDDGVYLIVTGEIKEDLAELGQRLGPAGALGVAWQIASAIAEMHERGQSHGLLHPRFMGVDAKNRLVIRPALAVPVLAEPDQGASAQATDCLQFAEVLDALGLATLDESSLPLLLMGLRREVARRRMQPGRAVRQSLSAMLARHPEWEARIVEQLDGQWDFDHSPWEDRSDLTATVQLPIDPEEVDHRSARQRLCDRCRIAPAETPPAAGRSSTQPSLDHGQSKCERQNGFDLRCQLALRQQSFSQAPGHIRRRRDRSRW